MVTLNEERLSDHTTLKIGGPAQRFYLPETREELIQTVRSCAAERVPYFILGCGSNVLFPDRGVKGAVIKNTESCREISRSGNFVSAGASVRLKDLVDFCVKNDLYGMEYLYPVPATVGGAVFMNAGRGEVQGLSISDHITGVEVFDGRKVNILSKEQCGFRYRYSVFHGKKKWVILSAVFKLPDQPSEKGLCEIEKRMAFVQKKQDLEYPTAGTVFKKYFKDLPELKGYRIGNAQFSAKAPGWIINRDGATYSDVLRLIRYARFCHIKHCSRVPQLELIVVKR